MPLKNRPLHDFAFKKTFGTPENRPCLISLLGRYNIMESEVGTASELDCWLFWLLHAPEYKPPELLKLLPQPAICRATETLTRIAEITEDKAMYDARDKAIRDRQWELAAVERQARREGEIKGKIKTVRILQGLLGVAVAEVQELQKLTLEQLQVMATDLQEKLRSRTPSQ
jgi:hypothetical protein